MRKNTESPIASVWISSWIHGMVPVVFIVTGKQVTSQPGDKNNTQLRKYCRLYTSLNGESYLSNLNTTFASLRRQLSSPQAYYAFTQTTNNGVFVYAFALCREYLSTSQCLACFDSAVNETKSCGFADGGNVIYDDCSIRPSIMLLTLTSHSLPLALSALGATILPRELSLHVSSRIHCLLKGRWLNKPY
ncbi:hypothetical protein L1987_45426 [Smallanthus sonchifolius]|uniref:Uncharacterized protein n=1 Tax=Smallanthus sonchifolius TaxID=185202 RepID=A0ACB9FYM7_9ASTR|nr:hypothetical protein L1987_45426 [Smallanthus sonchifolius]